MNFTSTDQDRLIKLMQHRRDIRGNNFLATEITDAELHRLFMAAKTAPSVGLSEPWELVIIRDKWVKQQIFDNFNAENLKAQQQFSDEQQQKYQALKLEGIIEAPVNLAIYYHPPNKPIIGNSTMPEVGEYSVVCAIQNMWLMARAMNIGIGWVSIIDPDIVNRIVNAPTGNKLIAYLCVGYVKQFYELPELEKLEWEQRRLLSTMVFQERFPSK